MVELKRTQRRRSNGVPQLDRSANCRFFAAVVDCGLRDCSLYLERIRGVTRRFDDSPRITQTGDHRPGDRLKVALVGTEAQLAGIMKAAKWYPAAAPASRVI